MSTIFDKISCEKMIMKDKGCHFLVGFVLSGLMIMFFSIGVIFSVVASVAVGKEVFDKYVRKTMFDLNDVVATIIGSIIFVVGFEMIRSM